MRACMQLYMRCVWFMIVHRHAHARACAWCCMPTLVHACVRECSCTMMHASHIRVLTRTHVCLCTRMCTTRARAHTRHARALLACADHALAYTLHTQMRACKCTCSIRAPPCPPLTSRAAWRTSTGPPIFFSCALSECSADRGMRRARAPAARSHARRPQRSTTACTRASRRRAGVRRRAAVALVRAWCPLCGCANRGR